MVDNKQMKLFLFAAAAGYNPGSWRHEDSRVEDLFSYELLRDMAVKAEEAKLHALFFSDWLSFDHVGNNPNKSAYEPFTAIAALAGVTSEIGLIATASTTFMEPWLLARLFTANDHLTKGRVGWNIVTSSTGEQNFNIALPPREERYDRAYDYMEAVYRIWDAWEKDAVIADRASGIWADMNKIKAPNYRSEHLRVQEPLWLPRSPQGRPVMVQAGASPAGVQFGATFAEAIFTSKSTLPMAKEYYDAVKTAAVAQGRPASSVNILPGMMPIVGDTAAEAQELLQHLGELISIEDGRYFLSMSMEGVDLSDLDADDTIPVDRLPQPTPALGSRYLNYYELAVDEQFTVRQLIQRAVINSGHRLLAGTPTEIADGMAEWFNAETCDGYALLPSYIPGGIDAFCDKVIPILQERGLFQTEYQGNTFRERLGLPDPERHNW